MFGPDLLWMIEKEKDTSKRREVDKGAPYIIL